MLKRPFLECRGTNQGKPINPIRLYAIVQASPIKNDMNEPKLKLKGALSGQQTAIYFSLGEVDRPNRAYSVHLTCTTAGPAQEPVASVLSK